MKGLQWGFKWSGAVGQGGGQERTLELLGPRQATMGSSSLFPPRTLLSWTEWQPQSAGSRFYWEGGWPG
jgi:hypothetical protein